MTEAEWLNCMNPQDMLKFLHADKAMARRKSGRRQLRLFAIACLRGIWPLLRRRGSRQAVEVAEQFADGLTGDQELRKAYEGARSALSSECARRMFGTSPYRQSAEAAGHVAAPRFDGGDHPSVMHASFSSVMAWTLHQVGSSQGKNRRRWDKERKARLALHADWLRDIFGASAFRKARLGSAVLKWREGTVVTLAETVYEERELPSGNLDKAKLAVLADALEEAGCNDADMIAHLRRSGPHVRGCWVVDLILRKS